MMVGIRVRKIISLEDGQDDSWDDGCDGYQDDGCYDDWDDGCDSGWADYIDLMVVIVIWNHGWDHHHYNKSQNTELK